MARPYGKLLSVLFGAVVLISCVHRRADEGEGHFRSWEKIRQSDTLRIGTMTSPSAFFIYRGEEMGSEYFKIKDFAASKGLSLEIKLTNSIDTLRHWVNNDSIDLCITPLPMTRSNVEEYTFCGMISTTSLVLLQRSDRQPPVRSVLDLSGKTIHTVRNSAEELRLEQIEIEIGPNEDFTIERVDTLGVSDLLLALTRDSIGYTVTSQEIARLFAKYHSGIDVKTSLSAPIRYGWVANKMNTSLADTLDAFFEDYHAKESDLERSFYNFFRDKREEVDTTPLIKGAISRYDHIFIRESRRLGWDWTVLAAIAFQESTFSANVESRSGAVGLMGIMPATGRAFGATMEQLKDPEVSVRVAVDCLLAYRKAYLSLDDEEEQIKFTLAAYNAGPGHIQDAIRLAEKHGTPQDKWEEGVRKYVLLKSNPEYYNDPVCKFGYLRGKETVSYVSNIMTRKEAYKAIVRQNGPPDQ